MVPGNTWDTVPVTSIGSSFATVCLVGRGFALSPGFSFRKESRGWELKVDFSACGNQEGIRAKNCVDNGCGNG
jgi:hypothetical protein